MHEKPIFKNFFTGGMRKDRALSSRDPRTYEDALNGDIVFTGSGDAEFSNEKGNLALTDMLPSGYYVISTIELTTETVIFSANETTGFSEIGIFSLDPLGTTAVYTTIFNDEFDPNGDLLNFNMENLPLSFEICRENVTAYRVYWHTKDNEPRVINTQVGKQSISEEFVNGDYTPLVSTGKYPHFYSVHSFALQPDVRMGEIKLSDTTIGGTLKSGMYELSYRECTRDGYKRPWHPLTRHFFVTLDPGNLSDIEFTMHDRSMYASNVMTDKGYQFTIEGVDQRFYELEVAYIYSTDKDVTVEASIFYREKIDPSGSGNVTVNFQNTSGIAVALEEFRKYIVPVRRVQTIGQKDDRIWLGGVKTYGPYELDLSGVTVEPFMKQMLVDSLEYANVTPLTNMATASGTVSKQKYVDREGNAVDNNFTIVNDFANYKGVQFEHLFSSNWGGETYPYALLVWDLKGNPWYAQHIVDYTMPNRYDGDGKQYQLMQGTDYNNINLMGLKFGNIDITDILFDEDGKLQVSAVQIVRCKRKPRILGQGILLPTVMEKNSTDADKSTEPLPLCSNDFHGAYTNIPDSKLYGYTSNGLDIASRPYTAMWYNPELLFGKNIFEGTAQDDVVSDVDRMDLVALYGCPYNSAIGVPQAIEQSGALKKYYTKNYKLRNDEPMLFAYGAKSRVKRMQTVIYFEEYDSSGYDEDDLTLKFRNDANIDDPNDGTDCGNPHSQGVRNVWLLKTKDYKNLTYYTDGSTENLPNYYVANYIVKQPEYYTASDQSSLEQRVYIGCGHIQPINQDVLDAIKSSFTYTWTFQSATFSSTTISIVINGIVFTSPAVTSVSAFTTWLNTLGLGAFGNASSTVTVTHPTNVYGDITVTTPVSTVGVVITGGDRYILNGVEVWGGDCYPWIFDFVRLYPKPGDCSHDGDCWSDYAVGVVVPLETSMNIALRRGRSFAGSGIRSQKEACGLEDPEIFPKGIMEGQPEEFYLNSVVMHETTVQSFISKPSLIDPQITDFDDMWIYSQLKIKGEVTDQYRSFLTSNRGQMDGRYGKITGRGYFGDNMYCLQERGFFRLRINELKALSTEAGDAISTGTPEVWQKPYPISVEYGTIHPYSIIQTPKAIYWADYYSKSFIRFAQDGCTNLSVVCEMKQWSYDNLKYLNVEDTRVDDEARHIAGGYDPTREKIYWSMNAVLHGITLVDETIVYAADPHINSFVSRMSFVQYWYGTAQGLLVSAGIEDPHNLYVHGVGVRGKYNGAFKQTKIKFVQNPYSDKNKLFDNAWFNMNEDAYEVLTSVSWVTDSQSQSLTIAGDTVHQYRNLLFTTPTIARNASEHLSGKTMVTEYTFTNADNKIIALTSHDQSYRLISKIR